MTSLFHDIIFGPVHSRRLGLSLGVNLLPTDSKLCSFDLHLLRMRLERRTPRRTAIQRPRRCPHAARSDAAPHGGGRHAARRHHLRRQRRADPASRIRSGDRRYDRPARRIVPVGQGLGALERHPAPPRRGAPRPAAGGQQHSQTRLGVRRHGASDEQPPKPRRTPSAASWSR